MPSDNEGQTTTHVHKHVTRVWTTLHGQVQVVAQVVGLTLKDWAAVTRRGGVSSLNQGLTVWHFLNSPGVSLKPNNQLAKETNGLSLFFPSVCVRVSERQLVNQTKEKS